MSLSELSRCFIRRVLQAEPVGRCTLSERDLPGATVPLFSYVFGTDIVATGPLKFSSKTTEYLFVFFRCRRKWSFWMGEVRHALHGTVVSICAHAFLLDVVRDSAAQGSGLSWVRTVSVSAATLFTLHLFAIFNLFYSNV